MMKALIDKIAHRLWPVKPLVRGMLQKFEYGQVNCTLMRESDLLVFEPFTVKGRYTTHSFALEGSKLILTRGTAHMEEMDGRCIELNRLERQLLAQAAVKWLGQDGSAVFAVAA